MHTGRRRRGRKTRTKDGLALDHLVVSVPDLSAAIAQAEALASPSLTAGRSGPFHKALISFADATYIELLNLRVEAARPVATFMAAASRLAGAKSPMHLQLHRMKRFAANGADLIEHVTLLRFFNVNYPDAYSHGENGRTDRHINPEPMKRSALGPWGKKIRKPLAPIHRLTLSEMERWKPMGVMSAQGMWILETAIIKRSVKNEAGMGFGLVAEQNSANAILEKAPDGSMPNTPAWCVLDSQYRNDHPLLMNVKANDPGPEGIVKAGTLDELAEKLGIPPKALTATVERFNLLARNGKDIDFGLGEGGYDAYFGDSRKPHHTLAPLEQPPFYAHEVDLSSAGAKGSARTNERAQVVTNDKTAIKGLYAAGNASAAFNGPLTVAAGATIPPAVVMGMVAAEDMTGRKLNSRPFTPLATFPDAVLSDRSSPHDGQRRKPPCKRKT